MAIVRMNKFTLLTFNSFKESLLKELQIFENVHFRNMQESDVEDEEFQFLNEDSSKGIVSEYESELSKIRFVKDKIAPYVVKLKGLKGITTPKDSMTFKDFDTFTQRYDYSKVYDSLKELDEKLKSIRAERTKLNADNDNYKSWLGLDISVKDTAKLKTVSTFIGVVSKTSPEVFRESLESAFDDVYVEVIGTSRSETTVVVISSTERAEEVTEMLKSLSFSKVTLNLKDTPAAIIEGNNNRVSEINKEEESIIKEIAEYAGESKNINIVYDYFKTVHARAKACENFKTFSDILVIEGWVPISESSKLKSILTKSCGEEFYLEEAPVEKSSREVPIKLKNNFYTKAFYSITKMYSLPKYDEIDPTPLHAPFYMAFFGIMVGDAGYGLVITLVALFLLTFGKGLSESTRGFMRFGFWLGLCTIAAGTVFGSMFGFPFFTPIQYINAEGLVAYRAILDSQLNIVEMIILSLVIGYFQIIFGLCVKGYMLIRDGKPFSAIFDSLFWIIAVSSGIFAIVTVAGIELLFSPGTWLNIFFASLVGLALTQGRESPSIGGKIGNGLYGVYGITSYVGDLVSYTRLVALALSGSFISFAFIQMVGLLQSPIVKIIGGGLILVAGLSLNFGLSLLGAYVHSCRLQYVEYFGKFYEGGGKPFEPLKLMNESVEVK